MLWALKTPLMKKLFPAFIFLLILNACDQPEKENTSSENTSQTTISQPQQTSVPESSNVQAESDQEETSTNNLIIPGKSVGLIKLHEQAEVVTKLLGKPDKADAAMGKSLQTWYTKPQPNGPDTATYETSIFFSRNMGAEDETSQAQQIRITSPFFKTENQTGVNATLAEIQQAFPEVKKTATFTSSRQPKKQITVYAAKKTGIAFDIAENQKCVGITLFEPGKQAFEVYTASSTNLNGL
jgi:hypothetical protein